jgi:hypothetical protein
MGAAAWQEARLAVAGTLRLAIGDRGGLACFDRSLDGFWRSFRAAVICYPLYLLLLAMRITLAEWERSGGWHIVTVETIGYVIAWVAFPLLMLWCQVPQSVLLVLVGIESETGILGARAGETIDLAAAFATLVYEWYIARIALETTGSAAAFVVLVDLVLGVTLSRVSGSLY